MAVASEGTLIGMCGLLKREHLDAPDLGYAFLPEAWGRGYAFEAARAVMEEAKRDRVLALVSPGNAASIRLLEKLGFASIAHPAAHEDTAVFEWRARALP
jgi:RimJ/RimL family protein N-acetyltransferase